MPSIFGERFSKAEGKSFLRTGSKYFKSDSYSPPEILPDDEWEDGTDFIDDYEPFWDERGEEEEENLQEPLYKVRFSDDYLVEVTLTFVSVTSLAVRPPWAIAWW